MAKGAPPRPSRRRRSRGRKPRGASVLATGAYIDPAAAALPHDEGGDVADDHDEDAADDAGGDMAEEAGSADQASAVDSPAEAASGPEGHAGDRGPAQNPERAPFSLFSWMRRDPAPRTAPAAPEAEAGPGTGKPEPME